MKRLNVFADKKETKKILNLMEIAQSTPVIALSKAHGDQGGFAGQAWTRVKETVYKTALAHGLPEIEGFYGFDPFNSEFIGTDK